MINSHGHEICDQSPDLSVTPRNVMAHVQQGAQHTLTQKRAVRTHGRTEDCPDIHTKRPTKLNTLEVLSITIRSLRNYTYMNYAIPSKSYNKI